MVLRDELQVTRRETEHVQGDKEEHEAFSIQSYIIAVLY